MRIPNRPAARLLLATCLACYQLSAAQTVSSQQAGPTGLKVDPSAGPLAPGGTPRPPQTVEAPPQSSTQAQPAPADTARQEPLGAAAAEQIRTAGGAASRPAGNAIAPTKQHQYRSVLIKLGAVAAAGIAVGTVYGLSHATPSTPPHSSAGAAK